MPLPKASHTQFLVLDTLLGGDKWGRDIRVALKAVGYKSTHASFYEMMDRMEQAGLIKSRLEERDVYGQIFREKRYHLTGEGSAALDRVANFYAATRSCRAKLGFQ
jgi:DNA-binding PadR family transcriptional regulator